MKVKVSVLVAVYNQEKYLKECLDSIVNQKTNFKYEILVHDDCSTDNSKKIIEDFYKKYPEKIRPFYEKENQYSKGVKINKDILIPKMNGKYFCFCEGDDYWIDDYKLQKQFDFLEMHSEYKFCIHNSIMVDNSGKEIGKIIPLKNGGNLECKDFILNGGGFVATNAIFSYASLAKNLPKYFDYMTLDFVWQIYLSSCGKTYCFQDYMSAYRVESDGSWTTRMNQNPQKFIEFNEKVINVLKLINEETNYKYDKYLKEMIRKHNYKILETQKDYKKMKKSPYRDLWKKQSFKKKIKYFLDEYFPKQYDIIKKLLKK